MTKMKSWILGAGLALVVAAPLLASGSAQAEPFAPLYAVPEGPAHLRAARERLEAQVPTKAEVGIPAYPGAVIYQIHGEEQVAAMIGRGGFAEIQLLSQDSEEEIIAFYRTNLQGWHFDETYLIFWQGDPEFSMERLMEGMPHITTQPAGPMAHQVMPEARHAIRIVYAVAGES